MMKIFPRTLAAVLMPDHLHIITESRDVKHDAQRLMGILSHVHNRWTMPDDLPRAIPDHKHLWRQIRYVHLNPCRAGLVRDPLEWRWSTYRDYMAVSWPCWPKPELMMHELKWTHHDRWREEMHQKSTSDPSVSLLGTPPLVLNTDNRKLNYSLDAILKCGEHVFRMEDAQLKRRCIERVILLQFAKQQPTLCHLELATHFGVTARALNYMAKRKVPLAAVQALTRGLCDRRVFAPEYLDSRTTPPRNFPFWEV